MARILKALGLMSGTSMDGIDAAILETDGETVAAFGPTHFAPYDEAMRARLRTAIAAAPALRRDGPFPPEIAALERDLTIAHAQTVGALLRAAGLHASDVDVIGFHGQTLIHRPADRVTLQIGSGPQLARDTGIAVVGDLRSADCRAGGQGAPIVPIYHQALARERAPVAVVNIGGVANVTYVGRDGELIAFDTGPGNAPIDDWALRFAGKPIDEGGKLAQGGRVHDNIVETQLAHPFFAKPAPKSLDRMDFTADMARNLSPADGAATLTAFTARAIAKAREQFPQAPRAWIVCGGGRHNPVLMAALRAALPDASVKTAEDVGWRGDFVEAEAIAFLAVRSLRGLPITFPKTTGVARAMPGGSLFMPH
jgi:anhydro-N-acetylmuramic acid kinase